jgi:hypothetical protein
MGKACGDPASGDDTCWQGSVLLSTRRTPRFRAEILFWRPLLKVEAEPSAVIQGERRRPSADVDDD